MAVFPPGLKEGRGIEHLEAVYAWAHTLLAYTMYYPVLCEHGRKRGAVYTPFPPWEHCNGMEETY